MLRLRISAKLTHLVAEVHVPRSVDQVQQVVCAAIPIHQGHGLGLRQQGSNRVFGTPTTAWLRGPTHQGHCLGLRQQRGITAQRHEGNKVMPRVEPEPHLDAMQQLLCQQPSSTCLPFALHPLHLQQQQTHALAFPAATLTVMPRSRSTCSLSRYCAWPPAAIAPVASSRRSASVDLPWSTCADEKQCRISQSIKCRLAVLPVASAGNPSKVTLPWIQHISEQ